MALLIHSNYCPTLQLVVSRTCHEPAEHETNSLVPGQYRDSVHYVFNRVQGLSREAQTCCQEALTWTLANYTGISSGAAALLLERMQGNTAPRMPYFISLSPLLTSFASTEVRLRYFPSRSVSHSVILWVVFSSDGCAACMQDLHLCKPAHMNRSALVFAHA